MAVYIVGCVAEAAVADQIDHDVLVEHLPVTQREAQSRNGRFGIVAVDVENGRFDHLRDVRAVRRRATVLRIAHREADLIVDDEMDRAAGIERPRLRQLERLCHDTLARERRIAVDEHGEHLLA
jgi:hypothetical protein